MPLRTRHSSRCCRKVSLRPSTAAWNEYEQAPNARQSVDDSVVVGRLGSPARSRSSQTRSRNRGHGVADGAFATRPARTRGLAGFVRHGGSAGAGIQGPHYARSSRGIDSRDGWAARHGCSTCRRQIHQSPTVWHSSLARQPYRCARRRYVLPWPRRSISPESNVRSCWAPGCRSGHPGSAPARWRS